MTSYDATTPDGHADDPARSAASPHDPSAADAAPSDPHAAQRHLEPPTVTDGFPHLAGGVPVLEDEVDQDLAHRPTESELCRTRSKVTAMMVVVLTTLSAIGPLATDMYIPAFPDVTTELATTAARLQLTITAFFLGTAAGQIVSGPISDRVGRRMPLLLGIVLCLIGSIGCALAPSVQVLIAFRILQGIGGGFGMVLGRAVLIDLTDGPELFRIMNIMQGIGGIAPIVAPLLGGLILLVGQWREVFWVIAGMSVISLIGVIALIPESLPVSRRHTGGFRVFLHNTGSLLRRAPFVAYLLVNMFSGFALMAYVSASSFVVQEMLGFSSTAYSVSFAINSAGMMAMSFLSAHLARTRHPREIIRAGLTAVTLGAVYLLIGVVLLGAPAWVILPGFFLLVAPQGLIFGNGGALASQEATDMAGTGSALLGLGFSVAASLAAPLVGVAGTHSALPMAITAVVGAALSVVCFIVAGRFTDGQHPAAARA
ncbi:multidrug effflux MFS transporter [Brachybacterium timonense]|uniref:multidrug effflux MFS transporter n=1 Tax=Brachybacterium timonense TaxID=2050896 RepID=UPI0014838A01|nr:multidrug effflux MFS transporter [Brachybacterium timonense]